MRLYDRFFMNLDFGLPIYFVYIHIHMFKPEVNEHIKGGRKAVCTDKQNEKLQLTLRSRVSLPLRLN